MGVAQENLVLEFLGHIRGSQMDVDAMTAMMSDDVVWQTNVPTWKPRVGREERGRNLRVRTRSRLENCLVAKC